MDSASKAFNPSVNAWANAVPEGLQVSDCEGGKWDTGYRGLE